MTASMRQQIPCTRKKKISLGSKLTACCKLALTLARQMWRHNYVIGRNEYLIFTLSESINPWVYSLQFLFKSTNNSWRYERKCEWVFFSEHSVHLYKFVCLCLLVKFGIVWCRDKYDVHHHHNWAFLGHLLLTGHKHRTIDCKCEN